MLTSSLQQRTFCLRKPSCQLLSFLELSKEIVETYLNIKIPTKRSTDTGNETNGVCKDEMLLYAREVLSLCLLWHGYHDAISEGDGNRVLRY